VCCVLVLAALALAHGSSGRRTALEIERSGVSMRKAMTAFVVARLGVLALGVGPASAVKSGGPDKCQLPNCYTAHYSWDEVRVIYHAATFYHLDIAKVPETGVAVLAFFLGLSPHPDQHPLTLTKGANHGSPLPATKVLFGSTFTTTEMQQNMASVSHYLALGGDDTYYVGGLFMGYLAAVGEARQQRAERQS